jgi:hypothetical protein
MKKNIPSYTHHIAECESSDSCIDSTDSKPFADIPTVIFEGHGTPDKAG